MIATVIALGFMAYFADGLLTEYEIKDGMLTLAFDDNHDLVIPLFQVATVDIVREE